MGFPSREKIRRSFNRIKNKEGTLMLAENPSALEKFRWDICQKFIKYKLAHKISQKTIAEMLRIDEGKISKILHHRIHEFSTDRLITLYEKLDPTLKLKVS